MEEYGLRFELSESQELFVDAMEEFLDSLNQKQ